MHDHSDGYFLKSTSCIGGWLCARELSEGYKPNAWLHPPHAFKMQEEGKSVMLLTVSRV